MPAINPRVSATAFAAVLLMVFSGCSRDTSSAKPEPVAAAPAQGQTSSAVEAPPAVVPERRHAITTADLPGPVEDVCIGANGKTMVLRAKDLAKLVVVDVAEGKILGYISLDNPKDVFAANAEKLVVVNRQNRVAKRYALSDLKPEGEGVIPGTSPISGVGMGANTQGPLFMVCSEENLTRLLALDLGSFRTLVEHKIQASTANTPSNAPAIVSVANNGSVFCVSSGRHLTSHQAVIVTPYEDHMEHSEIQVFGRYACPDDVGERIYGGPFAFLPSGGRIEEFTLPDRTHAIPAVSGSYYLTVPLLASNGRRPRRAPPPSAGSSPEERGLEVFLLGESRPVVSLPSADFVLSSELDGPLGQKYGVGHRLFLLPAAKAIVELPVSTNALVVHHVDLDEEVRRAFPNEPVIVSRPPRTVSNGETFRYQIQACVPDGKPVFKLDTAPDGMTLSENGVVEWTTKPRPVSGNVGAVVSVTYGGKTKLQSIGLSVAPPRDILADADDGVPPDVLASNEPRGDLRLRLPAKYDNVCVGGGGRLLVFTLPSLQKAAVFDIAAAKIIGYIPLDGECLVAASMEKLVAVSPKQSVIERFDLQTQKLEDTQPLSLRGEASYVAMGSASHGPVMVVTTKLNFVDQITLLDLDTLKRPNYKKQQQTREWPNVKPYGRVCASADGRVFSIMAFNQAYAYTFTGRELVERRLNNLTPAGWLVPDETGDRIYAMGCIDGDAFRRPLRWDNYRPCVDGCFLPAVHGSLYLRLDRRPDGTGRNRSFGIGASVFLPDQEKSLLTLRDLPVHATFVSGREGTIESTLDKRIYLIPNAKVIAVLPEDQEHIVLRRFDLDEELKQSGGDYLFVVSRPPRSVRAGSTFEYQLDVRSKAGSAECRLDAGPEGIEVSKTGLVRWTVAKQPKQPTANVRITVSDASGRSIQHNFDVTVAEEPKPASSSPETPAVADQESSNGGPEVAGSVPTPGAHHAQAPWQLTKIDDRRLQLSEGDVTITPGLRYESLLFLQAKHLAVLSADGMTIRRTHELGERYLAIAERADYYVAITTDRAVVDLLDKTTLAMFRRIPLNAGIPIGLAIHPTLPISYVSMRTEQRLPENGAFVVVDEATGAIHSSREYVGHLVKIDAAGQRLVAGGSHRALRTGAGAMLVPGIGPIDTKCPPPWDHTQWHQRQGAVFETSLLVVYDVPNDGIPILSHSESQASWNFYYGLHIAPDGLHTMCVESGGEKCKGFNLDALSEKPVEYSGGDGRISSVAYHPVLPMVACLRTSGPFLFERVAGTALPDGLRCSGADLEDSQFTRLWFSADGQGLLLDMQDATRRHCLRRVELNLTPADAQDLPRRLAQLVKLGEDPSKDAPRPGKGNVPLKDVQAFRGGRGKTMTAKEIGRAFLDSIVVVQSGQRFGTGFVVGSSGYILTCAHCVRERDGISISFRPSDDKDALDRKMNAKVVRIDRQKDLALLQTETAPAPPPPAIRLAVGEKTESGEQVTIIGNPGAGTTVLENTMTEGIVSNSQRQVGRQTLIQTSAAVNPGSSGAPMFNSSGLVIGLVVLKANIERVGFAVPAGDLAKFLACAVKAEGPEAAIERQWFDADGKHDITAKYLGVQGKAVRLERTDGKKISVPLGKLSHQDAAFVRLLQPDE